MTAADTRSIKDHQDESILWEFDTNRDVFLASEAGTP